jgi:hypothetical protein
MSFFARPEMNSFIAAVNKVGLPILLISFVVALPVGTVAAENVATPPSVIQEVEGGVAPSQCFGGDVWELSTRHLGCVDSRKSGWLDKIEALHWTGRGWAKSTVDEALSKSAGATIAPRTILYVHGNWMERDNARERVNIVDRYLARRATEPYRLIMLSWPSERNQPVLKDIRSNAAMSDANSVIVAELLSSLSEMPTQVSLLGFSLGARSVTGGLHMDAQNPIPHPSYRVSLVAPAVDKNWLQPGGKESKALTHVERMVNLYNSKDPILRRFRFIDSVARPIAGGFSGFEGLSTARSTKPLENNPLIRQYDCGGSIGATHSERSYYGECPYFCIALDNLLGK